MNKKFQNLKRYSWAGLTILYSGIILTLLLTPMTGLAAPPQLPPRPAPALPPRPGADLPPRPDAPPPAPPAVIQTIDREKSGPPAGAYIELMGLPDNNQYWTVVQWQDRQGNWHNVDGWQGWPDNGGKKWWVAGKDFGTGPFRWMVYQGQNNGPEVGHSDNFLLPPFALQTVQITIGAIP